MGHGKAHRFCIISSCASFSAGAVTHDVCIGKDTKAAATPEESATDADASEAAEEAGPSSKDMATDTPVGESHGCWCVWSSDLLLLRPFIVGQCGLAYPLHHVAKYSIGCVHCVFSRTYSSLSDCSVLQALNSPANLFSHVPCMHLTARSIDQIPKRQLLTHIVFISSGLMLHAYDVQAVLCPTSNSSSSGF